MSCLDCGPGKVELQGLVVDSNASKSSRSRKRIYKIVLLGDSSVGKTCLLRRFVRSEYSTEYKATIGADFLSKEITLEDEQKVQLQVCVRE
jgi:GTPase SAR1 family protein